MLFEISELWSILLNGNMQYPEMEQREYQKNKGDGLRKDGCCSGALSFNFAFVFIQSELPWITNTVIVCTFGKEKGC